MTHKIVATANHNRQIIEMISHGQSTYKIKQGKKYIGKTANGGYSTKEAAIRFANQ